MNVIVCFETATNMDVGGEPIWVKCALEKHAFRTRNARNLFLAGSASGYLRRVSKGTMTFVPLLSGNNE